MIRQALTPLAAACLMAMAATVSAAPSPYSTMVIFGDSLSDSGQFTDTDGTGYRRFTNRVGPTYQEGEAYGPVAPMILGGKLGISAADLAPSTSITNAAEGIADGNDWAVGGYRTDQIYDSITAVGGSVVDDGSGGTRTRDGYLVSNTVDPNALYYITGGGNDFLQLRIVNEATARASADVLVDSVQALHDAGARYIMVWLLPDLGLTPATNGTVLQSLGTELSGYFNDELVSALAASNANVIPLNIPAMLKEVLANPGIYGLATDQNLVSTCFSDCSNVNSVYGVGGTSPDPTKLLFNDSVHPTIAGQTLIADYAYSILAAPWEVTMLPQMADGTLRAYQDNLRSQWLADWENWQGIGQWRSFVSGGGQHLDFDDQNSAASGDGWGYNLNLGGSYRLDDAWRVGLAAGFYRQKLELGEANSDYRLSSYLGTAFAQYQQNRWWADLSLTGGRLNYDDLKRKFDLGPATREEKGDTDGHLWDVSARLGYDIAEPGSLWHLSPFVSADYARIEVDGYREKGSSSTALDFDDQTQKSRRLGAGLQGKYQITPQTQVFGEVAVEREYEDGTQDLSMALTSLPTNHFTLEGYTPQSHLSRASLGISQQLTPELVLRGGYSLRHADDSTQQGVSVALSLDF
ncbi:MAG: Esterase EstA [Stenotrophomonas maltophilia]|nr:MAG: Esterase EstA [Stenotrophomonas maltophilia]